jgi:hypothetical protein
MGFGGLITKTCDSRALRRAGALVTEQAVTVAVTAKQAISALPADFLPNEREAWAIIADALVNKPAVNAGVNSETSRSIGRTLDRLDWMMIQTKADDLVNEAAVNRSANTAGAVSERQIIQANAERIGQVRGEHRAAAW